MKRGWAMVLEEVSRGEDVPVHSQRSTSSSHQSMWISNRSNEKGPVLSSEAQPVTSMFPIFSLRSAETSHASTSHSLSISFLTQSHVLFTYLACPQLHLHLIAYTAWCHVICSSRYSV